jgi:glycosyltransferase involved in cell wall biosynthesis
MSDFALNCSRIGITGGLRSFAESVMDCLRDPADLLDVVLPEFVTTPAGVRKITTPRYLGSSSGVSLVRPIVWLAYSRYCFPVPREQKILCTTHHVLPCHKHQVVTVHDLRPYFFPDSPIQRHYFHHMLPHALQRCEGILTVSETSRQMLIDIYGLEQDRICVVPNAIRMQSLHTTQFTDSITNSNAPPYLLIVGASWAHKNADEVLRMHHHWVKKFRLVIVAGIGPYRSSLQSLANKLGIIDRVDFRSNITHTELQSLYAQCAALVYPSKMEGFGLPPLEAMAYGRPIIVSNIPIFKELYGSLPHYVDLNNEASWEEALSLIGLEGPTYNTCAIEHVRNFSMDRMSEALKSAIHHFWGMDIP